MKTSAPRAPTAMVVRSTKETGVFAIRDLSAGGARLVGPLHLFEGERINVRIELDEPFAITAEVVRVDQQRAVVEVAFRGVAPDALARIERSIRVMLGRMREASRPTVLVVHPDVKVSSALERDLARIGVAARISATLLELVWHLEDKAVRYVAVIAAGGLGDTLGPLLEHLEQRQPELRRVVLFGDQIEQVAHPAANRVHAVLRTPWRFKGLARALDVSMDSVVTTYDQLVALQMPIGVGPRDDDDA